MSQNVNQAAVTRSAALRIVRTAGASTSATTDGAARTERVAQAPQARVGLAQSSETRSWTSRAVCAGKDPDLLFATGAAQRESARLCQGCPVKLECLADALDNQVEFGVWGGLTERQRRAILRKSPGVTSWHDVLLAARTNAISATAG